jgi:hypothetical protein
LPRNPCYATSSHTRSISLSTYAQKQLRKEYRTLLAEGQ